MVVNSLILLSSRGVVYFPFPEVWGKPCGFDQRSTVELTIRAFGGSRFIKFHVSCALDFGNAVSQDSLLTSRMTRKWPSYNPSWTPLPSHPNLGTRCVREETSGRFQPLAVEVLLAECWDTPVPRTTAPPGPCLRSPESLSVRKELLFTPLSLG